MAAGSRWTICGKSPEIDPEAFSYSNLGGSWGAWLKYAGYDGIAVTGKADKPVYIDIDNGLVQIRDASNLWGKNALETLEQLQKELGPETRIMTIGQAGENMVTFATILATDNAAAQQYGSGVEVSMLATRLCDIYGLDTAVVEPMVNWLGVCYSAGVLTEEQTGLPLSRIGSADFFETLVRKISFREGFGDILALGTIRAAKIVGEDSQKLVNLRIGVGIGSRASEGRDYDPRLIPINILSYATEPRRAIQVLHGASAPFNRWTAWINDKSESIFSSKVFRRIGEEFWGSVEAADFSTYTGKALAAKNIQDYNNIKECLVLCDMQWPHYQIRSIDKNIGFSTLESRIFTAITGRDIDEVEFNRFGERIFNLQRAILINQGWGGRKGDILLDYLHDDPLEWTLFSHDCIVPGKDGVPTSRKGVVIERNEFEALKDEYYQLRGWDVATGFQTRAKLEGLELGDIADVLGKRGLVK